MNDDELDELDDLNNGGTGPDAATDALPDDNRTGPM
jgi:hypothetical protein